MGTLQTADISNDSRYKDTAVIYDENLSRTFLELWERPPELDDMELNSAQYLVQQKDIGRLDIIAYEYYGNVRLWWIIAAINNLVNVFRDMYEGQVLIIPDRTEVEAYVARVGRIVDETTG